ncbi:Glutaredoxin-C9 [Striga hermonthica]|uniref:Glutaredoxin-C9 n=1 Tax=Striga hermonthica TaxID=68872 RepID=A0A9N7MZG2_STRHE|nr:Glutaredoxin-C9 [Striga hermonthica]
MQHAPPPANTASAGGSGDRPPGKSFSGGKKARHLVAENAVVAGADLHLGCCMCHVIKSLLHGHGVNPAIRHVADQDEADVTRELSRYLRRRGGAALLQFPAVFVGGELFGGLDEVMGAHISGELVPKLKAARALWL